MVAALHDDVAVLARMGPCDAQRCHDSLGARVRKTDQLGGWHHVADSSGNLVFLSRSQCEHAAYLLPFARRGINTFVGVAEDDRAVTQPVVDVLVAVEVPDAGALAMIDVNRLVVPPVAEVRGDTEWQLRAGLPEVRVGACQLSHVEK